MYINPIYSVYRPAAIYRSHYKMCVFMHEGKNQYLRYLEHKERHFFQEHSTPVLAHNNTSILGTNNRKAVQKSRRFH